MAVRIMKYVVLIFSASIFFSMCASAKQNNAKYDVLKYSSAISANEKYLVTLESYTTNGITYHKKYESYLYGIAGIFIDQEKVLLSEKSIGFYFDKRENRKDRLYLGVDILVDASNVIDQNDYEKNARAILKGSLGQAMKVMNSCTDILKESEVKGVVVGFIWKRNDRKELINIWIMKEDMEMYFKETLPINELIIRSSITNTDGRIFRIAP
jgi:hypothetical protein